MLDGLSKHIIDPVWESIASPFVWMKATPNQVTFAGLVLILATSGAFLWHGSALIFGLTLAVAFAFDSVDGAVARRRNMQTKTGGYLDAVIDRYQELIVFLTIGIWSEHWLLVMLGFSGGVLTSYAKARTALEAPVGNDNWPDLFERLERVIFLCLLFIIDGSVTAFSEPVGWIIPTGLGLFAILTHVTGLQRVWRAVTILNGLDHSGVSETTLPKDRH